MSPGARRRNVPPRRRNVRKSPAEAGLFKLCGSHVAGDLAGLEARGANVQTLWCTLDESANTLDVWVPTTRRAHVGVRDALAEVRALAADFTYRRHGSLLTLTVRDKYLYQIWQLKKFNRHGDASPMTAPVAYGTMARFATLVSRNSVGLTR